MQNIFDLVTEVSKRHFSSKSITIFVINRELEELGIELTSDQRRNLESTVNAKDSIRHNLDFNEEQIASSKVNSQEQLFDLVEASLKDAELLSNLEKNENSAPVGVAEEIVNKASQEIFEVLKKRMPRMALESNRDRKIFASKKIGKLWGSPIDLLNIQIQLTETVISQNVNAGATRCQDSIYAVLARLCAKTVRVAKEVEILLRFGFPEGAYARWRTMYEAEVIACFIVSGDQVLARRFLDHATIRQFEELSKLKHLDSSDNVESIQFRKQKAEYENLLDRYGRNFRYDYGWASEALDMKKPTFKDIEQQVNMARMNPLFRFASELIHSGPVSIFANISQVPGAPEVLSGPSQLGLAIPGRDTARTLERISLCFSLHDPTMELVVWNRLISKFGRLAESEFSAIEDKIDIALKEE